MATNSEEWLNQADYDMETAKFMFKGGRFIYTIFMCHLSIEKALKGIYIQKLKGSPPKTHNLLYLIEILKLQLPENLYDSIFLLNRLSVTTRYPDNLQKMLKDYSKAKTKDLMIKSEEVLKWIKREFTKL
jgi:HEPN domain-containing protein